MSLLNARMCDKGKTPCHCRCGGVFKPGSLEVSSDRPDLPDPLARRDLRLLFQGLPAGLPDPLVRLDLLLPFQGLPGLPARLGLRLPFQGLLGKPAQPGPQALRISIAMSFRAVSMSCPAAPSGRFWARAILASPSLGRRTSEPDRRCPTELEDLFRCP